MLARLVVLAALLGLASALQSLQLYHRLLPSARSSAQPVWTKRGTLRFDALERSSFDEIPGTGVQRLGDGTERLYQVGIGRTTRREGQSMDLRGVDPTDGVLGMSVVLLDACILRHSSTLNETLQLHLTDAPSSELFHFRYHTQDISACDFSPAYPASYKFGSSLPAQISVEISRAAAVDPVHYVEAPAVVVGQDGKVQTPVKEKGLVEKYWVYAIPIVLVLLLAPVPEEEVKN